MSCLGRCPQFRGVPIEGFYYSFHITTLLHITVQSVTYCLYVHVLLCVECVLLCMCCRRWYILSGEVGRSHSSSSHWQSESPLHGTLPGIQWYSICTYATLYTTLEISPFLYYIHAVHMYMYVRVYMLGAKCGFAPS